MASVIARQRIQMRCDGANTSLSTNERTLRDLVGALDLAVAAASHDPDLLSVRASVLLMLGDRHAAAADLNAARRIDPDHVESRMLEEYGADWGGTLCLPPWSASERSLHPVIAAKWNRGELLQPVSDSLQPALAFVLLDVDALYQGNVGRYVWKVVNSSTPYGPLLAHYALIEVADKVRRQESIVSARLGESPGADQLLCRLTAARTCFLVVARPNGEVLHNLRFELPAPTRRELVIAANVLLHARTDAENVRAAIAWHAEHFDMDLLSFDA